MIKVCDPKTGKKLQLDAFWLRDHCRCERCYNHSTSQRKCNLLDIPANVRALETISSIDGQQLTVKWNDGHDSVYKMDFLLESQVERLIERAEQASPQIPWDQRTIVEKNGTTENTDLRVRLSDLIRADGKSQYKLIRSLVRYGLAFIDEVPPTTIMTELALRRTFPIMRTFFGEIFTFTDTQTDFSDTAYSRQFLGSHTDNTYFSDAAGLHSLHCLNHTGGDGGENFFVDGLWTVLELKRLHPEAFELLTKVQVPGEYLDGERHHRHSAPIIQLDDITGKIVQLRLNVYDRGVFNTLPQKDMKDFYDALRKYLAIVQNPNAIWTFKLQPGTLVVFDNWRVYHGRHAYTGNRTMSGAYIQRTDFLSEARVRGLID